MAFQPYQGRKAGTPNPLNQNDQASGSNQQQQSFWFYAMQQKPQAVVPEPEEASSASPWDLLLAENSSNTAPNQQPAKKKSVKHNQNLTANDSHQGFTHPAPAQPSDSSQRPNQQNYQQGHASGEIHQPQPVYGVMPIPHPQPPVQNTVVSYFMPHAPSNQSYQQDSSSIMQSFTAPPTQQANHRPMASVQPINAAMSQSTVNSEGSEPSGSAMSSTVHQQASSSSYPAAQSEQYQQDTSNVSGWSWGDSSFQEEQPPVPTDNGSLEDQQWNNWDNWGNGPTLQPRAGSMPVTPDIVAAAPINGNPSPDVAPVRAMQASNVAVCPPDLLDNAPSNSRRHGSQSRDDEMDEIALSPPAPIPGAGRSNDDYTTGHLPASARSGLLGNVKALGQKLAQSLAPDIIEQQQHCDQQHWNPDGDAPESSSQSLADAPPVMSFGQVHTATVSVPPRQLPLAAVEPAVERVKSPSLGYSEVQFFSYYEQRPENESQEPSDLLRRSEPRDPKAQAENTLRKQKRASKELESPPKIDEFSATPTLSREGTAAPLEGVDWDAMNSHIMENALQQPPSAENEIEEPVLDEDPESSRTEAELEMEDRSGTGTKLTIQEHRHHRPSEDDESQWNRVQSAMPESQRFEASTVEILEVAPSPEAPPETEIIDPDGSESTDRPDGQDPAFNREDDDVSMRVNWDERSQVGHDVSHQQSTQSFQDWNEWAEDEDQSQFNASLEDAVDAAIGSGDQSGIVLNFSRRPDVAAKDHSDGFDESDWRPEADQMSPKFLKEAMKGPDVVPIENEDAQSSSTKEDEADGWDDWGENAEDEDVDDSISEANTVERIGDVSSDQTDTGSSQNLDGNARVSLNREISTASMWSTRAEQGDEIGGEDEEPVGFGADIEVSLGEILETDKPDSGNLDVGPKGPLIRSSLAASIQTSVLTNTTTYTTPPNLTPTTPTAEVEPFARFAVAASSSNTTDERSRSHSLTPAQDQHREPEQVKASNSSVVVSNASESDNAEIVPSNDSEVMERTKSERSQSFHEETAKVAEQVAEAALENQDSIGTLPWKKVSEDKIPRNESSAKWSTVTNYSDTDQEPPSGVTSPFVYSPQQSIRKPSSEIALPDIDQTPMLPVPDDASDGPDLGDDEARPESAWSTGATLGAESIVTDISSESQATTRQSSQVFPPEIGGPPIEPCFDEPDGEPQSGSDSVPPAKKIDPVLEAARLLAEATPPLYRTDSALWSTITNREEPRGSHSEDIQTGKQSLDVEREKRRRLKDFIQSNPLNEDDQVERRIPRNESMVSHLSTATIADDRSVASRLEDLTRGEDSELNNSTQLNITETSESQTIPFGDRAPGSGQTHEQRSTIMDTKVSRSERDGHQSTVQSHSMEQAESHQPPTSHRMPGVGADGPETEASSQKGQRMGSSFNMIPPTSSVPPPNAPQAFPERRSQNQEDSPRRRQNKKDGEASVRARWKEVQKQYYTAVERLERERASTPAKLDFKAPPTLARNVPLVVAPGGTGSVSSSIASSAQLSPSEANQKRRQRETYYDRENRKMLEEGDQDTTQKSTSNEMSGRDRIKDNRNGNWTRERDPRSRGYSSSAAGNGGHSDVEDRRYGSRKGNRPSSRASDAGPDNYTHKRNNSYQQGNAPQNSYEGGGGAYREPMRPRSAFHFDEGRDKRKEYRSGRHSAKHYSHDGDEYGYDGENGSSPSGGSSESDFTDEEMEHHEKRRQYRAWEQQRRFYFNRLPLPRHQVFSLQTHAPPPPAEFWNYLGPQEQATYMYFYFFQHYYPDVGLFKKNFREKMEHYMSQFHSMEAAWFQLLTEIRTTPRVDPQQFQRTSSRGAFPGGRHPERARAYDATQKQLFSDERESLQSGSRHKPETLEDAEVSSLMRTPNVRGLQQSERSFDVQSDASDSVVREPLKHKIPHPIARFGPGGQLIRVIPTDVDAPGHHHGKRGGFSSASALVEIKNIGNLICEKETSDELVALSSFPGPLIPRQTLNRDVVNFCVRKVTESRMWSRWDAVLIWRLLETLVRQEGKICGADLAELLMEGYREMEAERREENPDEPDSDEEEGKRKDRRKAERETSPELESFQQTLMEGRQKESVEMAVRSNLWSHALFLARMSADPRLWDDTCARFANCLSMDDPLCTLYSVMMGQQAVAAVTCIQTEIAQIQQRKADRDEEEYEEYSDGESVSSSESEGEGTGSGRKWRRHLAILLANLIDTSTQQESIFNQGALQTAYNMGQALANAGQWEASHFCLLATQLLAGWDVFARIDSSGTGTQTHYVTLLGKATDLIDPSEIGVGHRYWSIISAQTTEIYEYALGLRYSNVPVFALPGIQIHKAKHALKLAELGFGESAHRYSKQLYSALRTDPSQYPLQLFVSAYNIGLGTVGSCRNSSDLTFDWLHDLANQINQLQIQRVIPSSLPSNPAPVPNAESYPEPVEEKDPYANSLPTGVGNLADKFGEMDLGASIGSSRYTPVETSSRRDSLQQSEPNQQYYANQPVQNSVSGRQHASQKPDMPSVPEQGQHSYHGMRGSERIRTESLRSNASSVQGSQASGQSPSHQYHSSANYHQQLKQQTQPHYESQGTPRRTSEESNANFFTPQAPAATNSQQNQHLLPPGSNGSPPLNDSVFAAGSPADSSTPIGPPYQQQSHRQSWDANAAQQEPQQTQHQQPHHQQQNINWQFGGEPLAEKRGSNASSHGPPPSLKAVPHTVPRPTPQHPHQGASLSDQPRSPPEKQTESAQNTSSLAEGKKNSSWVGDLLTGIAKKVRPRGLNEMILPDDKNPAIRWDEKTGKYVGEVEKRETPPPPPMDSMLGPASQPQPQAPVQVPDQAAAASSQFQNPQKQQQQQAYQNQQPAQTNGTTPAPSTGNNIYRRSAKSRYATVASLSGPSEGSNQPPAAAPPVPANFGNFFMPVAPAGDNGEVASPFSEAPIPNGEMAEGQPQAVAQ